MIMKDTKKAVADLSIEKKDTLLSQLEVDQLLKISELLEERKESNLIDEIKDAILDSGKLSLPDWRRLRNRLKEIERLIPHIDLIIELKGKSGSPDKI